MDEIRYIDALRGSQSLIDEAKQICHSIFSIIRKKNYSKEIQRDLFSLAADSASFTGWVLFDNGADPEAQRYFRLALRAAQHAGDDMMAATTLAFMSIQLYNLCEWKDASQVAGLGESVLRGYNSPHMMSSMLTRRARSLAGQGDTRNALSVLERAFAEFDRGKGSDHPYNVDWVTVGEIHGQASGVAALLGDVDLARRHLDSALAGYGPDDLRSSSLHRMRIAVALLQAGQVKEACDIAESATSVGTEVESFRFEEVRGDFMVHARDYKSDSAVKDLRDSWLIGGKTRLPISLQTRRRLGRTAEYIALS
ncbi:MAG: hypothetical protein ACRCYU_22245 [Nocardioides sp.]